MIWRCEVEMVHPDESRERCRRHRSHVRQDTDHIDKHGHRAPVLVTEATLRELRALEDYDRRELMRKRLEAAPLVTVREGDIIRAVSDTGRERVMRVSGVEHHIILLADITGEE